LHSLREVALILRPLFNFGVDWFQGLKNPIILKKTAGRLLRDFLNRPFNGKCGGKNQSQFNCKECNMQPP
jgi:hypothetical protein